MTQQPKYFEIARGNLADLLEEINMETQTKCLRLVSIVVLTDVEYEERKEDAAWERDRLKELEDKRESILDEADGRLLTREEWDELEGVFPGTTDWEQFDPSNIGPYVAILERVDQESKRKSFPDPNIDDEIPC